MTDGEPRNDDHWLVAGTKVVQWVNKKGQQGHEGQDQEERDESQEVSVPPGGGETVLGGLHKSGKVARGDDCRTSLSGWARPRVDGPASCREQGGTEDDSASEDGQAEGSQVRARCVVAGGRKERTFCECEASYAAIAHPRGPPPYLDKVDERVAPRTALWGGGF